MQKAGRLAELFFCRIVFCKLKRSQQNGRFVLDSNAFPLNVRKKHIFKSYHKYAYYGFNKKKIFSFNKLFMKPSRMMFYD